MKLKGKISDITEVSKTRNPIASSAASFDRVVIKGKRQEMMCAVQDKKGCLQNLKRKMRASVSVSKVCKDVTIRFELLK